MKSGERTRGVYKQTKIIKHEGREDGMIQVQSVLNSLDNGGDKEAKVRHANICIECIQ